MVTLRLSFDRAAAWTSRSTYRRRTLKYSLASIPSFIAPASYVHHEWRSTLSNIWTSTRAPRRLLIVDDDASLQTLLRILLTSSGFDVMTAGDGRQALALAQSNEYDLILLDLEMPVMNGREFYREFRQLNSQTPVVIISAFGADLGQQELGAQGSISKPFDPSYVQRIVESLVQPQM